MPQGWDLGVPWGVKGVKTNFPKFQPEMVCELHELHMQQHNFCQLQAKVCARNIMQGVHNQGKTKKIKVREF